MGVALSTELRAVALEGRLPSLEVTAPAVRAVDEILAHAVLSGASDVHVEPLTAGGRVRERVDGILREERTLAGELFVQVVARLKLLAGMDIADRRQPQDGRYDVSVEGHTVDARVSSMPTIDGERVVIRLLNVRAQTPRLDALGMSDPIYLRVRALIQRPHGFVLACGPTGSGKTTTLYAALSERNVETQSLCSVEDPVEARIAGVHQVQVNARAGVTFAGTLRSFLRQDANVIMVGELRDEETAAVAVSAALCGQLVLATLHAVDAPRAVERLVDLGIKRTTLASILSGIIAQRLVRVLCGRCKTRRMARAEELAPFGVCAGTVVYEPKTCEGCSGGYDGRTALFECLLSGASVREAISAGVGAGELASIAQADGYRTLARDGGRILVSGTTGLDELRRGCGEAV